VAQDLSPTAHFLVRLRVLHPLIAVGAAIFVVSVALQLRQVAKDAAVQRWAGVVAALFIAQIALGFLNLWLLAPAVMQILHLLMADAVWVALVALCAVTLAAPASGASSEDAALEGDP